MLTLQFIPNTEIANLDQESKLRKLISLIKSDRILVLEGGLSSYEEMQLIERTMEQINKEFRGIEICTVSSEKRKTEFSTKIKEAILKAFGYKSGLTIIGPASIVKEIRRDPTKIELFAVNKRPRKK
ncbi:DUF2073 domain-containing protein [Candidatus Woesearchaeota archaeon]|nr:DUF2073 domain-containing protein [Candidatus Woesearchaeota archaeon]